MLNKQKKEIVKNNYKYLGLDYVKGFVNPLGRYAVIKYVKNEIWKDFCCNLNDKEKYLSYQKYKKKYGKI